MANELLQAFSYLFLGYYIGTGFRCLSCVLMDGTSYSRRGTLLGFLCLVLCMAAWLLQAYIPSVICFAAGMEVMIDTLYQAGWYRKKER